MPDTGTVVEETEVVSPEATEEVVEETWTPPTREDWDNVQGALKKARQDARAAKRTAPLPEDAHDVDKAVQDASDAATAKYKPLVVKAHARAAFAEAGLLAPKGKADSAMARAIRLLDLTDIDVDEDGEVNGLSEQIEEIKSEFPELFASTRRPAKVDGADKSGSGVGQAKSTADMIAGLLSGR